MKITDYVHFNGKRAYESASNAINLERLKVNINLNRLNYSLMNLIILLKTNEEGNQNSDKRKTYIFARQLFRQFNAMLFVDRDELLFCSKGISNEKPQLINLPSNFKTQSEYQHSYIQEMNTNSVNS